MTRARACLLAFLLPASVAAQPPGFCNGPERPLAPSRDLYCIELIAAPGIDGASGRVEMAHLSGPFTFAVTAEGRPRISPVLTLSGLPDVSTLGGAEYVAWIASPVMHPIERLGAARNGETRFAPITFDKFVVLITAERSAGAREPSGRIILRGASPSTRLQPADLMQFNLGATRDTSAAQGHEHHPTAPSAAADSARWTTVPMPPGLQMLPAEMTLRPDVEAYLPPAGDATPAAQPRRLVRLSDGDTLRLTAGLVRRSIKGVPVTMFAFNGQHPGPLIDVRQGGRITVVLLNELDQPTTVHWHGIRLDNRSDGVPELTQPAVPAGGRYVYDVRLPDAGIYWYHPHVREDLQQDLGLYGNLIVRSPRADYFSPAHREEILMLDDLLLNQDGLVPFGRAAATHALMGRFGNVMLVNGEPGYSLSVREGEVVRFYLTNVSNTRTLNLGFAGARMKLVAADVGNFEREEWVESVVISPAERYVVHVQFERAGDVALVNRVQSLDHLFGRFSYETDTLGVVRVRPEAIARDLSASFQINRIDKAVSTEVARFRSFTSRPPDRSLVLTIETQNLPFFTRQMMQLDSLFFTPVEWSGTMPGMNWASTSDQVRWIVRDPATGKENMDIDWTFRRGEVVKLRIANERRSFHGMQHPIHIHGQRFLVLAVNDVPATNLAWKDTVLVPAGFTVDLVLELSNPGRWMLHCHIAEHLSAHMMSAFTVR